jgi:four helix bundle protein
MKEEGRNSGNEQDLRERTKEFALRIVRMYVALPKVPKRRCSGSRCSVRARQLVQTIARPIAGAARLNSLPNAAIACGEIEETAYWLELIVESGIVTDEKLKALRQECNELTAIFITIIKKARRKEEKI